MFSVVLTRKHYWHLVGGEQGIKAAYCIAQAAPQQRLAYPAQNVSSAEAEKLWFRSSVIFLSVWL